MVVVNKELWLEYFKEIAKGRFFNEVEILKIANEKKWTIAHEQAKKGWTTENEEVLCLADYLGRTVAHIQASKGWTTNSKKILKLTDKFGITVAHFQVLYGNWETEDKEVLQLKDGKGWSVAHALAFKSKKWTTNDPEILSLTNEAQKTVLTLQVEKGWIPDLSNPKIRSIFERNLKENYLALVNYYSKNDFEVSLKAEELHNFFNLCQIFYPGLNVNIPLVSRIKDVIYAKNFFKKKIKNLHKNFSEKKE